MFYPSTAAQMNTIGRDRGWPPYTRESFDAARSLRGALYVGDPEYVAEKIVLLRKNLGLTRFLLHVDVSTMPHHELLRTSNCSARRSRRSSARSLLAGPRSGELGCGCRFLSAFTKRSQRVGAAMRSVHHSAMGPNQGANP
ncbi:hypothetical protein QFZ77_002895 [Paenibacillus sp. V4I3]|nr:hypothetical protein [Paenibacillus sp. V4I3]